MGEIYKNRYSQEELQRNNVRGHLLNIAQIDLFQLVVLYTRNASHTVINRNIVIAKPYLVCDININHVLISYAIRENLIFHFQNADFFTYN